jgi:hypothetical protein
MSNSYPNHLASPPSIKKQAQMIGTWLFNSFAKPRGCRSDQVKIMANMRHLWEEIYNRTKDEPTILIVWNGEKSRGGFNQANTLHRVDRRWIVVILRGHGFKNLLPNPDANPEIQEEDFYDSVEILRDKIRVMLSISEEFPIDYVGIDPMPGVPALGNAGNAFIDGFSVSFSCANDIPGIAIS